jgi:lipid-binding SYLF domain-containing protein
LAQPQTRKVKSSKLASAAFVFNRKEHRMNPITMNSAGRLGRRAALRAAASATLLFAASPVWAQDDAMSAQGIVDKARISLESLAADKNFAAMRQALKSARGVLIFPQLLKGGFFVGGSGGTGVLLARDAGDQWKGPAFYTIGSASIGVQFGGEAAETVIVVNSQKALDGLYANQFKLGADGSIAAGPIGKGAALAFTTDMVSFSRSKGAFFGVSLEGSVLDVRDSLNHAYYKAAVSPLDILVRNKAVSAEAAGLRAAVAAAAR